MNKTYMIKKQIFLKKSKDSFALTYTNNLGVKEMGFDFVKIILKLAHIGVYMWFVLDILYLAILKIYYSLISSGIEVALNLGLFLAIFGNFFIQFSPNFVCHQSIQLKLLSCDNLIED
jgi:hypothetical protein